jgi:transglutaminase-like putative cysteine protease
MIYEITHTTTYDYEVPVSVSHHLLRLHPRRLQHQRCVEHDLRFEPRPAASKTHIDYYGNRVTFVTIEGAHKQLVITSHNQVEIKPGPPTVGVETPAWETVRDLCRGQQLGESLEASEFLFNSPMVRPDESYVKYAGESFLPGRPISEAALDLAGRIHRDFTFDAKATTVATPLEEVYRTRRGVCQDFAHFQVACLRSIGLPARYVSGYLETNPPDGQPRLAGSDASHAWVSYFCPALGWMDVDPTNNLVPGDRHITIGWGRDFSDVSPIRGVVLGGGRHTLKVAVDVIPRKEGA